MSRGTVPKMDHNCVRCGSPFTARRQARYCSNTCRQRSYEDRQAAGITSANYPDERVRYMERPWLAQAECANWPSIDFFNPDDYATAVDICNTACDVAGDCLDYALRTRQEYGVWGGKTPNQRAKVRRRR